MTLEEGYGEGEARLLVLGLGGLYYCCYDGSL